jgi:hypothetical protein
MDQDDQKPSKFKGLALAIAISAVVLALLSMLAVQLAG